MSEITTPRPISRLRQRMLDELAIGEFGDKTRDDYIRHVKTFTVFIGRSPDTATPDDLRAFQANQRQNGVQPPTMNSAVSALRFFFTNRPELGQYLRIVKQPQKLPVVLTQDEAARLMGQPLGRSAAPSSALPMVQACASARSPTCSSPTSTAIAC
jgi:site-specific recombinase XerD